VRCSGKARRGGAMDKGTIQEIAEQAYKEESLPWSVSDVSPNPDNNDEWEIYYDAWGRKYHKILVRLTPRADSTPDSLKAEVRDFLRGLKESGRL
ncbi:MAG TPA: hypothetical protein VNI02_01190, partial [Blastocatellia bacterium]|nr:hypothetical protein [Blastocatellia bacterium]